MFFSGIEFVKSFQMKNKVIFGLIVATIGVLTSFRGSDNVKAADKPHELSEFKFYDSDSNLFNPDELKGSATYIMVWGVHCSVCARTMPDFNNLTLELENKDNIKALSICTGDDWELWKQKSKKLDIRAKNLYLDAKDRMKFRKHIEYKAYPQFLVYNGKGKQMEIYANPPTKVGKSLMMYK